MHLNHNSAAGDEFFSGIATDPDASKKTLDKPVEAWLSVRKFSAEAITMAGQAHKNIFGWWWWANISAGVCPS
jgi:hypothetical protein